MQHLNQFLLDAYKFKDHGLLDMSMNLPDLQALTVLATLDCTVSPFTLLVQSRNFYVNLSTGLLEELS